jgi:hypothetical protein
MYHIGIGPTNHTYYIQLNSWIFEYVNSFKNIAMIFGEGRRLNNKNLSIELQSNIFEQIHTTS